MAENNPLILYQKLRDTLRRYIPTTLPISRNYPELKKAFLYGGHRYVLVHR